MKQEMDSWEDKFHALNLEKIELQKQLKEKNDLIELLEQGSMKRSNNQEDLLSSHLPIYGVWKGIIDQLVMDKDAMKSNYEREIKRLCKKYQLGVGSSSDMIP